MGPDILIVDDEADICELIAGILDDEGYQTRTASNGDEVMEALGARLPSLVILDVWLQGSTMDGLDILAVLKKNHQDLPVIVISGHGTIETAVAAIRRGAYDFIEKPFKTDKLLLTVRHALEAERLRRENAELKEQSFFETQLIGTTPAIKLVRQTLEKAAISNSRVFISGPSGAGKDLAMRLLHTSSPRSERRFIKFTPLAVPAESMETEIFGEEDGKGQVLKTGLLEQAHNGSFYFDEVTDLPDNLQKRLLRVLIDNSFRRQRGIQDVRVNVRILSSSSKNIQDLIKTGAFIEDLYHRLNVVSMSMPALSKRREDIPLLVHYFTERLSFASGLTSRLPNEEVVSALQSKAWPGNVRELRNHIERFLITGKKSEQQKKTGESLPAEEEGTMRNPLLHAEQFVAMPLRRARQKFEKEYLIAQIKRFEGNISRTAAFIGMERSALHRKLKTLGIKDRMEENYPDD